MLYTIARPLLFSLPPETAHALAMRALECRLALTGLTPPPVAAQKTVMGLTFANPVGLAAGFDKNAAHVDALATLGFGFIEVGGVTPRPQSGSPPPRLFRLPEAGALINRMGFNNIGVSAVAANLARRRYRAPVGINLGKNADTLADDTATDYLLGLEGLYPHGDFFVLNVSSPNTANLRDWQKSDALHALLTAVLKKRDALAEQHKRRAPVAVKIAPDMTDAELQTLAEIINTCTADGVVAVNTTTSRPPIVRDLAASRESGGLSGKPLAERANAVIRILRAALNTDIAIIGVGGIDSVRTAQDKFAAGADLIQLYTGLVYQGANLPLRIIRALRAPAPPATTTRPAGSTDENRTGA